MGGHLAGGGLGGVECAVEVGADGVGVKVWFDSVMVSVPPFRQTMSGQVDLLQELGELANARVADEYVQSSERCDRLTDEPLTRFRLRDVTGDD